MTTAALFASYGDPPLSNQQAWTAFEGFLEDERIAFQFREPWGLSARWLEFAGRTTASPNLWMDAYLAAFALAGGYQMVTTDSGFKQFEGLDLVLIGSHPS